jgi:hypothetical protein
MEAQAETRTMHDAAVAIEDVRPVMVRLAGIEREEFLGDGNRGIACGGNRPEQFKRAAEFLVEYRARQVVASLRTAAEKEPAAQLLVRLIDSDVLAGYPRVPDEKRARRQSAKSSTDDVRLRRPSPRTPRRNAVFASSSLSRQAPRQNGYVKRTCSRRASTKGQPG